MVLPRIRRRNWFDRHFPKDKQQEEYLLRMRSYIHGQHQLLFNYLMLFLWLLKFESALRKERRSCWISIHALRVSTQTPLCHLLRQLCSSRILSRQKFRSSKRHISFPSYCRSDCCRRLPSFLLWRPAYDYLLGSFHILCKRPMDKMQTFGGWAPNPSHHLIVHLHSVQNL